MQTINETRIRRDFVCPELCETLFSLRVPILSDYYWEITKAGSRLLSYAFDEDKYYLDGDRHRHYVSRPDLFFPAYTIKTIEKVLPPGYLLTLSAGSYELMLDDIYKIDPVKADRLPDAFALMLLNCLSKRILDLTSIKRDQSPIK